MDSVHPQPGDVEEPLAALRRFRQEVYCRLSRRPDALFELADALACADGPVRGLAGLSLVPEHRRGHGGMYDALDQGRIEIGRLRRALTSVAIPRMDGQIVLAVDVSPWPRPAAETSPQRSFCHTPGGCGNDARMVPGWPYSMVAALESGRSSWVAVLDAVRLRPNDDLSTVTATQLREVVDRLIAAGHWRPGDPPIRIVMDAGYDVTRLAWLLADLPVELTGRLRRDRVMLGPAPPDQRGKWGRPARHGTEMAFARPDTHPVPDHEQTADSDSRASMQVTAWHRLHPRLTRRGPWADHPGGPFGELPIIEGTVIRVHTAGFEHPMWLWTSDPHADADQIHRAWRAYLRRFDLEHTFRFFKQTLGWTTPKQRDPDAADRWTWLVIIAHTQLRLARTLTADLRRPWERPCPPGRLTPARVRRGFRYLRPKAGLPASAPKPSRPGPGRPPGTPNQHRAPRHPVAKTPTHHKPAPQRVKRQVTGLHDHQQRSGAPCRARSAVPRVLGPGGIRRTQGGPPRLAGRAGGEDTDHRGGIVEPPGQHGVPGLVQRHPAQGHVHLFGGAHVPGVLGDGPQVTRQEAAQRLVHAAG